MDEKKRRGRPRSPEAVERDERIYRAVAGSDRAVTKYEIAAGTGIPSSKVYMSLRRLSLANLLSRVYVINKQHYWSDRPFTKPDLDPTPGYPIPAPVPENELQALIPAAVFSSPE